MKLKVFLFVTIMVSLSFARVKTDEVQADSLKLGTGSYLKNYLDTTFYDSLYESTYLNQRAIARVIQVGKVVTLYQPSITTTTSGGLISLRRIPVKFRPSTTIGGSTQVRSNGAAVAGYYNVLSTGIIYLLKYDDTNLEAGSSGAASSIFTWVIN